MLDVIEAGNLLNSVARAGRLLRDGLRPFMDRCEPMADVRGEGLFVSIEWVTDRKTCAPDPAGAAQVVEQLKARGFLTSNAGAYRNIVKLRPPLVFSEADAGQFLDAFEDVLAAG